MSPAKAATPYPLHFPHARPTKIQASILGKGTGKIIGILKKVPKSLDTKSRNLIYSWSGNMSLSLIIRKCTAFYEVSGLFGFDGPHVDVPTHCSDIRATEFMRPIHI
jgi:hypothetical protein